MVRQLLAISLVLLCAAGLWATQHANAPLVPLQIPAAIGPARVDRHLRQRSSRQQIRVSLFDAPVTEVGLTVDSATSIFADDALNAAFEASEQEVVLVQATAEGIGVNGEVVALEQVRLVPQRSPGIWVAGRLYRGEVRVVRAGEGLSVVNVLPLEEYLPSVLDGELPALWPREARRAQVIVARTYAVARIAQAAGEPFDVYASTRSQRYLGVIFRDNRDRLMAGESEGSRELVRETRGRVLRFGEEPVPAYFTAACGGRTAAARDFFPDAAAHLVSVRCDYCSGAPLYRWSRMIDAAAMQQACRTGSESIRRIEAIDVAAGDLPRFRVITRDSSNLLDGLSLQRRLAASVRLPSPHFALTKEPGGWLAEGGGFGHGVGFCQWGAKGLAETGADAAAILKHYFPAADIVEAEAAAW